MRHHPTLCFRREWFIHGKTIPRIRLVISLSIVGLWFAINMAGLFAQDHSFNRSAAVTGYPSGLTMQAITDPSPDELSPDVRGTVSETLGRENPIYHAHTTAQGIEMANPHHGLMVQFTSAGVEVWKDEAFWSLSFASYGRGKRNATLSVSPLAQENRVEYGRGVLTEWYVNGPGGLQQGMTLTNRPTDAAPNKPLQVVFSLSGDLITQLDADDQGLTLVHPDGRAVLRYRGLAAWDATGRNLPIQLRLQGRYLTLEVDDSRAQYPITIDPFIEDTKLTASDGDTNDWFGVSVDLEGTTLIVGAPQADIGGNPGRGAVYIYKKVAGAWVFSAKLNASDGAPSDLFGFKVALEGNTLAVGAYRDDISVTDQGSVYIFENIGGVWTETAKLTASDGATDGFAFDLFGFDLALNGGTLAIGAFGAAINFKYRQGAVYVFEKIAGNWTQTAKLIASDGVQDDWFGWKVALSGQTIVVASARDDIGSNINQGSVYVFEKISGTWTQTAKLIASDGSAYDFLGYRLAFDGNTLLVDALGADIGGNTDQGAVYVFEKVGGTWTETAKLTSSDGASGDVFGGSLLIEGNRAIIGAFRADVGGAIDQGAVYEFEKIGGVWTEKAKITASDGMASDRFGNAVDLEGNTLVVGAYLANIGGSVDQGAVYVFNQLTDFDPPACDLVAVNPGPPVNIDVALQDVGSGLASINVLHASNATVTIPSFTPGTTDPVIVNAAKIDNSQGASVTLEAFDMEGNRVVCDPVYTRLSVTVPEGFALKQNYPNPFNPVTTIHFDVAGSTADLQQVSLKVFDLNGQEVKTLVNDMLAPGQYSVQWDGTNNQGEAVAGGVYIYRMIAGDFVATRKMILMK